MSFNIIGGISNCDFYDCFCFIDFLDLILIFYVGWLFVLCGIVFMCKGKMGCDLEGYNE